MKTLAILGIFALSLTARAADQPKPPEGKDTRQLLQEGLFEEEANRDLKKAGSDYSAVLQQYETQRNVAATALFRLAEIRGMEGNKAEAVTLFRRLLTDFPNDEKLVKLSRERLAALGAPASPAPAPLPDITDDEAKEIIRLRQIVKDSPDLLNAFTDGETPLSRAAKNGWLQAATFLLENHAQITPRALRLAASEGHKTLVELILDHGADVNVKNGGGATALHGACEGERLEIVRLLLERGADPNVLAGEAPNVQRDWWTGTPLLLAIAKNRADIAKLLLEYGANPNMSDPVTVGSPLTCAVESNASLVQFLLDHGADPNFHDPGGPTALKSAIRKGSEALVSLLLSAHADPNEVDYEKPRVGFTGTIYNNQLAGYSPLFQAVSLGDETAARELLAHGARVDSPESNGLAALDRAVAVSPAMVRLLLDHGASPVRPPATETPLHYSIACAPRLGEPDLEGVPGMPGVRRLIRPQNYSSPSPVYPRAAQPGARGPQTPNASAASETEASAQMKPILEIWELLLAKGAEINATDAKGMTPLHYAARNDQIPLDALQWLIDHGAKIDSKDTDGQTPMDFLTKEWRQKIEQKQAPAK